MYNKDDEQLRLPGFENIDPPKVPSSDQAKGPSYQVEGQSSDQVDTHHNLLDAPSLAVQQNALPASLKASAETSIDLRNVQRRLAAMLTKEDYIACIASCRPEVLPELMNSITGGIATADNLMIQTMREASKNSTTNKILEYMVQQQQQISQDGTSQQKDKYYDESIDKIKMAIFHKLDKERNKQKRTAQDYIDPKDTEVIDAEYSINEEAEDGKSNNET